MKRLLPLIVLVVSLFIQASPARGCSCALLEPSQLLEFAPTAFVGMVVANTEIGGGGGSVEYTFEVETVLAGEVPAVVEVTTAANGAACGFEATPRTRMAVFATDEGDGVLASGLCSTSDADLAIEALGPGTPPAAGGVPGPEGTPFDWQAVGLAAGGLVVVAGAWLAGRRRA